MKNEQRQIIESNITPSEGFSKDSNMFEGDPNILLKFCQYL